MVYHVCYAVDVCRRNWSTKIDPVVIKNSITEYLKHAPQRIKRRQQRSDGGRRHFIPEAVMDVEETAD